MFSKQIFNIRLSMFVIRTDGKQRGYIPDIFEILKKYDLLQFIVNYITSAIFPNKLVWKRLVKNSIYTYESSAWLQRMSCQNVFDRFLSIHPVIKPAIVWKCSSDFSCWKNSKVVSKIWTDVLPKLARVCQFCEFIYTDLYSHILTMCPLTQSIRNDFLELVFLNYGQRMFDNLKNGESEDILRCIRIY